MKKYLELSDSQKRVLYSQIFHTPQIPLYNIGGCVVIHGRVNIRLLEVSIQAAILSNDIFRLRLAGLDEEDGMRAYYGEESIQEFPLFDFSETENPEDMHTVLRGQMQEELFNLDKPLFRIQLIKFYEECYGFTVVMHHLISDGWSFQLLYREIGKNYEELLQTGTYSTQPKMSYVDVLKLRAGYIGSERYYRDRDFWVNQFEGREFGRKQHGGLEAKRKTCRIEGAHAFAIREFCSKNLVSMNQFLFGAYILYMSKSREQKDIVTGLPLLGRYNRRERSVMGMFVNPVSIRFVIHSEETVNQFLNRVGETLRNAFKHQHFPLNHLLKELNTDVFSLYPNCFNYYGTVMEAGYAGMKSEAVEYFNGYQEYDLQLIVREWSGKDVIQMDFDYQTDKYTDSDIAEMYREIVTLSVKMAENQTQTIGGMNLLDASAEKVLLHDYNCTGTSVEDSRKTILELFHLQVLAHPEAIAVKQDGAMLTYAELEQQSDELAIGLRDLGVGRNSIIIGIVAENTMEVLVMIFAVWKSGSAYLPIEPDNPKDRIIYQLRDADVQTVLTNIIDWRIEGYEGRIISPRELRRKVGASDRSVLKPILEDLAYLIYTSGSTGHPKGVMIRHSNLSNYIVWAREHYNVKEGDVFPLYSSLAFDLTVTSLFTPLISGGRIKTYGKGKDEFVLYSILKENESTVVKLTPTHLSLLQDTYGNSSIRAFIVGGEELKTALAERIYNLFAGQVLLYNEYGPTEATVGCMCYTYYPEEITGGSVPIGAPISNTEIYLLDSDGNPVPVNQSGEIYVGGAGIADGYLNQKALTEKSFVRCLESEAVWYRTGDRGKFINDKTMVYIGRKDRQIKIRGHRVDLGEVEKWLFQCEGILDSVAIYNEETGNLCAYYTATGGEISPEVLRGYLKNHIPEYMIPLFFIKVPSFSFTINGKLDTDALPPVRPVKSDTTLMEELAKPASVLNQTLAKILHLREVHSNDDFYQLGGDSIKAIQLSSEMKKYNYMISVKNIMTYSKLSRMYDFIHVQCDEYQQEKCTGYIKVTPAFHWFQQHILRKQNEYCQCVLIEMSQSYPVKVLQDLIWLLLKVHDILRLNYSKKESRLYFDNSHLEMKPSVKEWREDEIDAEEVAALLIQNMDICSSPLLRTGLVRRQNGKDVWCIAIHHLGVDGVSWRIILEDIDLLLERYDEGKPMELPAKTASYQLWAAQYDSYHYALQIMENEEKSVGEKKWEDAFFLESKSTALLLGEANEAFHTTPVELLMSAFLYRMEMLTGDKRIIIQVEHHGREGEIDLSRTIGWFTKLDKMIFEPEFSVISEVVNQVKSQYRQLGRAKGYEDISEGISIRFNYLGEFRQDYSHFIASPQMVETDMTDCDLEIDCMIIEQEFMVRIRGKEALQSIFPRCVEAYEENLQYIAEYCSRSENSTVLPSDFELVNLSEEEFNLLFE